MTDNKQLNQLIAEAKAASERVDQNDFDNNYESDCEAETKAHDNLVSYLISMMPAAEQETVKGSKLFRAKLIDKFVFA